jgi:ATP-dependent DNA helicase PIF1
MMSLKIIEILNDIGKCARKNFTAPFGGVQVVFIGDFFQLPPIGGMDEPTASQYCFESSLWGETFTKENHIKLTQIFRQKGDNRFIKILSQVREGRISRSSHELLISMIGKTYQGEMVPTKLFPLRASADNLNARTFALIDSPVFTYEFEVKTDNTTYLDDGSPIPYEIMKECGRLLPEYVNNEIQNLVEMSPCSSTLLLKVGAVVMLCYNLNVEIGLCNGSQGVVVGFSTAAAPPDTEFTPTPVTGVRFPLVRFTNGITTVITQQYYQSLNYPTISFSQIPLKLAWGLTIHSSQGATLDMAEIDIGSGVFEVGQTYVALSRVKSLDGLYLLGYDPTKIKVSRKVIDFYQTF